MFCLTCERKNSTCFYARNSNSKKVNQAEIQAVKIAAQDTCNKSHGTALDLCRDP